MDGLSSCFVVISQFFRELFVSISQRSISLNTSVERGDYVLHVACRHPENLGDARRVDVVKVQELGGEVTGVHDFGPSGF